MRISATSRQNFALQSKSVLKGGTKQYNNNEQSTKETGDINLITHATIQANMIRPNIPVPSAKLSSSYMD